MSRGDLDKFHEEIKQRKIEVVIPNKNVVVKKVNRFPIYGVKHNNNPVSTVKRGDDYVTVWGKKIPTKELVKAKKHEVKVDETKN